MHAILTCGDGGGGGGGSGGITDGGGGDGNTDGGSTDGEPTRGTPQQQQQQVAAAMAALEGACRASLHTLAALPPARLLDVWACVGACLAPRRVKVSVLLQDGWQLGDAAAVDGGSGGSSGELLTPPDAAAEFQRWGATHGLVAGGELAHALRAVHGPRGPRVETPAEVAARAAAASGGDEDDEAGCARARLDRRAYVAAVYGAEWAALAFGDDGGGGGGCPPWGGALLGENVYARARPSAYMPSRSSSLSSAAAEGGPPPPPPSAGELHQAAAVAVAAPPAAWDLLSLMDELCQ